MVYLVQLSLYTVTLCFKYSTLVFLRMFGGLSLECHTFIMQNTLPHRRSVVSPYSTEYINIIIYKHNTTQHTCTVDD